MTKFGQALKGVIVRSGLKNTEVAQLAKITPSYLSHLLKGFKHGGPQSLAALLAVFSAREDAQQLLSSYLADMLDEIAKQLPARKATADLRKFLADFSEGRMAAALLPRSPFEALPPEDRSDFVATMNAIIRSAQADPTLLPAVVQLLQAARGVRARQTLS